MEWASVVDSAVKIGLGALIAAVASYLTLCKTHRHEIRRDKILHQRQMTERKRLLYLDFLTASSVLTQKYRDTSCNADGVDYFDYQRLYHDVSISSDDEIRLGASNVLYVVNQYIVINKNGQEYELLKKMKEQVNDVLGMFQLLAKQDIESSMSVQ
ncbi:peptidase M14 [Pantoea sp. EKM10T]|uniref:peptidase M14 n=1 Tax=Pantoea sp. EKM10T TaxID=2708058 RepID=UPI00142DE8E6|nr:peptidase M14 [Pantoea sp. EKM10T]KAF6625939.1 peptidase M14 [Pantoea sp. EKM10T]